MRKKLVIGILRETKEAERRAPLTPADVEWLVKRKVPVEVESSRERVYPDDAYRKCGAKILDKFHRASLLVGIKEPQVKDLYKGRIYMMFSHTTKGQWENRSLLPACLKQKITLIDYEKIVDIYNKRLVYFGKFAGLCGMLDSLHYFGKKLEWQGIKNPLVHIKPAWQYPSLRSAKKAVEKVYERIQHQGFEKTLSPFIIGITGHGNVSRGAQEILKILNPLEIHPKNILRFVEHQKKMRQKIYKIVFLREEKIQAKNGKGFYFEEYLRKPEQFESNLDKYLPHLNMLVNTSYWDKRYPRLVPKNMIHKLVRQAPFRLGFIGDITCDINGSIELTYKSGTPENPVFTYDYRKKKYVEGYKSDGITILAVDNLPSEMPKDASSEFSRSIRDYVYQIAIHGAKDITKHAALPGEIRNAVITQNGRLTANFNYLKKYC